MDLGIELRTTVQTSRCSATEWSYQSAFSSFKKFTLSCRRCHPPTPTNVCVELPVMSMDRSVVSSCPPPLHRQVPETAQGTGLVQQALPDEAHHGSCFYTLVILLLQTQSFPSHFPIHLLEEVNTPYIIYLPKCFLLNVFLSCSTGH